MARGKQENGTVEGDVARRRLAWGIARSRKLIDQYRLRLLLLRKGDPQNGGDPRLMPRRG